MIPKDAPRCLKCGTRLPLHAAGCPATPKPETVCRWCGELGATCRDEDGDAAHEACAAEVALNNAEKEMWRESDERQRRINERNGLPGRDARDTYEMVPWGDAE